MCVVCESGLGPTDMFPFLHLLGAFSYAVLCDIGLARYARLPYFRFESHQEYDGYPCYTIIHYYLGITTRSFCNLRTTSLVRQPVTQACVCRGRGPYHRVRMMLIGNLEPPSSVQCIRCGGGENESLVVPLNIMRCRPSVMVSMTRSLPRSVSTRSRMPQPPSNRLRSSLLSSLPYQ
ncbi:hypothetical protein EDD15DRAFT_185158 [Pisolithus albus]|nr:hypothetical protein EDD15DRAFT_185158 [Pisolithus albus]